MWTLAREGCRGLLNDQYIQHWAFYRPGESNIGSKLQIHNFEDKTPIV